MTLVELVISVALLGILSASVAAAVSIGYRAIGPGGLTDRQQVVSDVSVVQKSVASDVGRASCVVIPHSPSSLVYGDCSTNSYVQTDCQSAILCVGWPDFTVGVNSCRVAVYQAASNQIWRQEFLRTSLNKKLHLGGNPQGTSPLTVTVSPLPTTAPSSGVSWVTALAVSVTSGNSRLLNPAGGTFSPGPVVNDPKAVTAGAAAC